MILANNTEKEGPIKLGHQAPKGWRVNKFNSIEVNGDLAYCASHHMLYDSVEEERKLYNGEPCYYTDSRFYDGRHNYYKNSKIHWTRWEDVPLRACKRYAKALRNTPVGTIISFEKSWFFTGKRSKKVISGSYLYKVSKENKLDIVYEINDPGYSKNFTNCKRAQEITDALRANGFIVKVSGNSSFIGNMINTAAEYMGGEKSDTSLDGEVAIAYGYNKVIGFSSFNNDYHGYSNGCDHILYDFFQEFDKWSRCAEITKTTPIEDIINILKEKNDRDDS